MGKNLGLSSRIVVWLMGSPWFILGRSVTTLLRRWRSRRRLIFNWRAVFFCELRNVCGWNFKDFFLSPLLWGRDPNWRAYFSNGLVQPPTRQRLWLNCWKIRNSKLKSKSTLRKSREAPRAMAFLHVSTTPWPVMNARRGTEKGKLSRTMCDRVQSFIISHKGDEKLINPNSRSLYIYIHLIRIPYFERWDDPIPQYSDFFWHNMMFPWKAFYQCVIRLNLDGPWPRRYGRISWAVCEKVLKSIDYLIYISRDGCFSK